MYLGIGGLNFFKATLYFFIYLEVEFLPEDLKYHPQHKLNLQMRSEFLLKSAFVNLVMISICLALVFIS